MIPAAHSNDYSTVEDYHYYHCVSSDVADEKAVVMKPVVAEEDDSWNY